MRVEEYKRPTFEVKLQEAKQAFRLNRPANVTGEARYYFGLPVTAGSVRWRVTREPVYPDWWGWRWGAPVVQTQTVATGTARLDGTGQFSFTFTPRAAEPAKPGESTPADKTPLASDEAAISYRYHVDADVTDEGGETRSADRSFRLGLISVEARLDVGVGFLREGEAAKVSVVRTDLDGTPRAGNGSWRLAELVQPPQPLLPADQPAAPAATAPPWRRLETSCARAGRVGVARRDDAQLARGGSAGGGQPGPRRQGRGDDRAAGAGAGRLPADVRDDRRLRRPATRPQPIFVVAGAKTPLMLPAALIAESPTVNVGGTARLLVTSGFAGQPILLEIWRDGKRTAGAC